MKRIIVILVMLTAIILTMNLSSEAVIKRVPSRYNMLNFYGGYADPHGEYENSGLINFVDVNNRPIGISGDSLYSSTYYLGIDYGTLYRRHVLYMLGFRFTEHNVRDWIFNELGSSYKLRQYDIEFNINYYMMDLLENQWSPYIGAGVQGGFTTFSQRGFDNDSQPKFAFSLNLGFDLKIFQANKRSFVTLASMNNFNLLASDDRPKYLNLGVGIRYFFR